MKKQNYGMPVDSLIMGIEVTHKGGIFCVA